MCLSALRPLRPTLHLLQPQRQTAKQTWVGKFAVLSLLGVLSVNVSFIFLAFDFEVASGHLPGGSQI